MSFDAAFTRTIGIEGGYSNNPTDRGGETMFGITATVARANGYLGPMAEMPIETAKAIYREEYWNILALDQIDKLSPAIAGEMFDTGVNCGTAVAAKFLQRALNAYNRIGRDYADMPVDGAIGPQTWGNLAAYLKIRGTEGEKVMLDALNSQQGVRYFEIAERHPEQEDFEYGWWRARVAL